MGWHSSTVDLFRKLRYINGVDSVGYLNLVNKRGQNKPNKSDIDECQNFVKSVIKKRKPKFIIGLGSTVFSTITNRGNFKTWVGKVFEIKIDNERYFYIPVYHPEYASKSKERTREYNTQLDVINKQVKKGGKFDWNVDYELIINENRMIRVLDELSKDYSPQSFDYETTGLEPSEGYPVCLSISNAEGRAFVFYWFDKDYYNKTGKVHISNELTNSLQRWMFSDIPKIAQNAKFEIKWTLQHFGIEPNNIINDTKQTQHLINENGVNKLSDMAYKYTDMGGYDNSMIEFLERGNKHHEAKAKDMLWYSGGDSDVTLRISNAQQQYIDKKLNWLNKNIIIPAVYTLARMENRGMYVDWTKVETVKSRLNSLIYTTLDEINKNTHVKNVLKKTKNKDGRINLNSPKQVKMLLYDEMKLPVIKETKSGQPSTDQEVIEKLSDKNEIIHKISLYRSWTYQLGDIETIEKKRRNDNTVYSDLIQDYVITGRLSSRNPNLQNMKGGDSLVKSIFVSRFNSGLLLQADYSQLELRLVGSESKDPKLIQAFKDGLDLHSYTASNIFDYPYREFVNKKSEPGYKEKRTAAKRINFGTVYGITEHGLSQQIGVSVPEAKEILRKYWSVYTGIKEWMDSNVTFAKKNGYVRNKFGRIRHLSDINSDRWWVRESNERQASNFKIQSLGADINMWAMNNVDRELINRNMRSMVIGQIHDSVICDCHPDEFEDVIEICKYAMQDYMNTKLTFLNIPLKVDLEVGESWKDMKEIQ
jgi:DNA polymerase-1